MTPRHASGQIFCTTVFYSSLPLIWYATWLCLHKMEFGTFGATPPGPAPWGYIKIMNMFLQSSFLGLSPVKVSRFYLKWSKRNGVTLQTDVRPDGRTDEGYHNIPVFSSNSAGINMYFPEKFYFRKKELFIISLVKKIPQIPSAYKRQNKYFL